MKEDSCLVPPDEETEVNNPHDSFFARCLATVIFGVGTIVQWSILPIAHGANMVFVVMLGVLTLACGLSVVVSVTDRKKVKQDPDHNSKL